MMHAKTTLRTAAFVLRVLDYGESDRIVTFYTEDFGKLKGIAKGAKRSRRRFANALEPFSCIEILFSRRGRDGLALIEDSTPICHYASVRADLERTLIASYLIDLTDQFTLEGKRQADIYRLLAGFLDLVAQGPALESLWRFFELRLLKLTGYEPVLDRCLACRSLVDPDQSYQFVPREGGLKCGRCGTATYDALPISIGTIRTLLLGRDLDLAKLPRLVVSPQTARESQAVLTAFIRHHLGRDLKSMQVVSEIRKLCI
ncbi:MAG TPA: DNA repair protein RecO [Syntrophales bacterium]|nr:DNA repair protein RecO [Syntrophales bacterium]